MLIRVGEMTFLFGSFPLNSGVCIMSITLLSVVGTNDIFYAIARLMRRDIGMDSVCFESVIT